jgi:hypothetical protein
MASRTKVLRPDVRLDESDGLTSISFAHWQVEFPSSVLENSAPLLQLVKARQIDPRSLDGPDQGLITLLDAQGCFIPVLPDRLTARSVLGLFQPLRSQLYAQYYGHPAWARLRTGQASRGELTAWMVHNYHVSRSAGVIAARMAATTQDAGLREFFREDALEEFWHCDAFYFVDQVGVQLTPSDVKSYVALPASTAFEDHALRVAEENSLGHLLIAYFQESSIIFRPDSERFYDLVEANYELSNAFVGWRKHMTLDMDHDHAGELEARFDDYQEISLAHAKSAIRAVQLAQFFLLKALDQIVAHANVENALVLRLPSTMVHQNRGKVAKVVGSLSYDAGSYLLTAVRDGAFRALALARTHDQIIAAGRLASHLRDVPSRDGLATPEEPWLIACRNFLVERSAEPSLFVDIARTTARLIAERCPELRDKVDKVLARETSRVGGQDSDLAEIKLVELLDLAASGQYLAALTIAES